MPKPTILRDNDLLGAVCTACGRYMRFTNTLSARDGFVAHVRTCPMRKDLLGAEEAFEVALKGT